MLPLHFFDPLWFDQSESSDTNMAHIVQCEDMCLSYYNLYFVWIFRAKKWQQRLAADAAHQYKQFSTRESNFLQEFSDWNAKLSL
jgi:hypothetical protein